MGIISRIYNKFKETIKNNKILTLVSVTICTYCIIKIYKNHPKEVKLSYFLMALK